MLRPYLFILLLLSISSTAYAADQVTFRELTASNSPKELLLYGAIQGSFTTEIEENLQNGIEIYCSFFVQVYKSTPDWPEELVHEKEFRHSIKYDTLKQNYIVQLENRPALRFADKIKAESRFEQLLDIAIAPLSLMVPEQNYTIRIKAELKQKSPQLGVSNILPFITALNKKTKWYSVKIRY